MGIPPYRDCFAPLAMTLIVMQFTFNCALLSLHIDAGKQKKELQQALRFDWKAAGWESRPTATGYALLVCRNKRCLSMAGGIGGRSMHPSTTLRYAQDTRERWWDGNPALLVVGKDEWEEH